MNYILQRNLQLRSGILNLKQNPVIAEWILFVIHPVSALLLAIVNYKASFAKNIVWLFVAFYGFTMVVSDEGMDASRYRDNFIHFTVSDLGAKDFVNQLYKEGSSYVDVAEPLISFAVSRFTGDPRVLFAVFGLIFGYFYSRNIWFLLERVTGNISKVNLIYIFVFAIIVGFWQINGFRMWTAAHIFFYGAIKYLYDNRKIGILISAISILFHFSFMFPVSLLILFVFIPKRISFLYWFFIVSSFLSEINIDVVSSTLTNILPGVFHSRIQGYTSQGYAEVLADEMMERNWRYILYGKSIKWVLIVYLSLIYFNGIKFIKENPAFKTLFCFSLYFMALTNVVSNIPSIGRFFMVAYLFVYAFIFLYLQNAPDFRFRKTAHLFAWPLLFFYCFGMVNIALSTIGIVTVLGNPIILFSPSSDLPIPVSSFL